jgi:phosphoglycerate dehydrogenase-like enzyme
MAVEERQVVFACPGADVFFVAVRSAVAVGAVAVVLLQKLLVLELQVLLEDNAPDVKAAVLVSEACLLLSVRRVKVRVVVDFAGPADAGVEGLRGLVLAIQRVRIKQVSTILRQDDSALIVTEVNGLDQPLIAEVVERVVADVELVLGNDTEGADGGQCSAVLAVQFVNTVTINDQLALLAARQVEVAHQAVARIVIAPVPLVVHARLFVAVIPLPEIARITPSSVRHRFLLTCVLLFGFVREDALAVAARGDSGRRRGGLGRRPQQPRRGRDGSPSSGSGERRAMDSARMLTQRNGAAADQKTASVVIRPTPGVGQVAGVAVTQPSVQSMSTPDQVRRDSTSAGGWTSAIGADARPQTTDADDELRRICVISPTMSSYVAPPGPLRLGILDDYQDITRRIADWGRLPANVSVTVFNDHVQGDELIRRLIPFDMLVVTRERTPFSRYLLERLPNLKLLVTTGARNLAIDLAACRDRGVLICGTDSGSLPTAELAWGLVLAVSRHIVEEDQALRSGKWQTTVGVGLAGKTLGVLGLGRIGAQVARIGRAFGMTVIAWSENLTAERAVAVGCARVERSELFRSADVLSIHLLLSDRTRGIVAHRELAWMKSSAILINTARASLVDERALVDALRAGTIAGAGLDVHAEEPLPSDAPIRVAPNTVLTPHLGYVTKETYDLYYSQALEDVEAWLAGKPIRVLSDDSRSTVKAHR